MEIILGNSLSFGERVYTFLSIFCVSNCFLYVSPPLILSRSLTVPSPSPFFLSPALSHNSSLIYPSRILIKVISAFFSSIFKSANDINVFDYSHLSSLPLSQYISFITTISSSLLLRFMSCNTTKIQRK